MGPVRVLAMELPTAGKNVYQYRIQVGANIKYVTVEAGALDDDLLMNMALNFHNIFTSLEYSHPREWTEAHVSQDAVSGELVKQYWASKLPGVQALWHPEIVDFLDIETKKQLSPLVQECEWKETFLTDYRPLGRRKRPSMIAKIARFRSDIGKIETETQIYQLLEGSDVAPKFLGHMHEAGWVNSFLLEKVQGRSAREPCGSFTA
ncbi:hypothetical protein F4811DRAFT_546175 [Daldinia bambusicola]|nr:hypothetical protein F4811DRAFT_546175 [Daldinia bambusicola]